MNRARCVAVLAVCLQMHWVAACTQTFPLPKTQDTTGEAHKGAEFRVENSDSAFKPVLNAFRTDWQLKFDTRGRTLRVKRNAKLADEEYRIHVNKDIAVEAATPVGLAWALESLGQNLSDLRKGEILDRPDVPFRCLMVDVARRYHSLSTLRSLIRWCQAGKVRYMQLHLTDDQNWMLPSEAVPGADTHNSSGHPAYTKAELKILSAYGLSRGVTIVPEIDVPGHSMLLAALNPSLFRIKGSASANCLNFGSQQVRDTLKRLIKETASLFAASPYLHIGCDEAWFPDAEKDPEITAAIRRLGPGSGPNDVFVDFVGDLADYVLKLGKTPLIWEGFPATDLSRRRIPKGAVIVAWDGGMYPASKLVPDGYRVVNAGWDPYYVVNHYPYDVNTMVPLERLYNADYMWFRTVVDDKSAFRWQNPQRVLGSMLCWWEGREWNAQSILPLRILAFGAKLWNGSDESDYASFLARSSNVKAKVERQLRPFAIQSQAIRGLAEGQFETSLHVNLAAIGKPLTYAARLDGKTPAPSDVLNADLKGGDRSRLTLTSSGVLTVQAYDGMNPVGETFFEQVHKVSRIENLALDKPVFVTG